MPPLTTTALATELLSLGFVILAEQPGQRVAALLQGKAWVFSLVPKVKNRCKAQGNFTALQASGAVIVVVDSLEAVRREVKCESE